MHPWARVRFLLTYAKKKNTGMVLLSLLMEKTV